MVLCIVVILRERERIGGLFCVGLRSYSVCGGGGGLEEPFVVLGTFILCERGRELEVSCVVLV